MADLAAGSSAGESASLTLDKRDSLESKLHRASSDKISCLQETVSLLNQRICGENQGQLQNDKELKILGKDFKKQMKENKSLTLKLCQKKIKIKKKINTININKKLNRKEVLNNRLKSEYKELRYQLAENLENLKEQATRLQKCIAENRTLKKLYYYKAKTRKLEADKAKKIESDPSLLLKD